jgi:sec-independent protein translocase protein TatC
LDTTTQRLALIIKDLRRAVLATGLAVLLGCLGFYSISRQVVTYIQNHLHQKLAFFTVAEPFLAHLTISLAMTIFTLMPMLGYFLWRALAKPFNLSRSFIVWFVLFTCFLFYSGAAFCYFFTLPFGIDFLLGFQTEQLRPVISISKFVSFVSIFVLAFGLIFELPIFMIFMAKIKILPRSFFEKNRRYAALVISVIAALLTPTPDVFNMMLMGVPLYMLYEVGIIALKLLRIA